MINATKKWIFLKVSSIILIPLMVWFIINLVSIYEKDYVDIVSFFSTQPSKFLTSLLMIVAFFYSSLSISEIFEDYINDKKIKVIHADSFKDDPTRIFRAIRFSERLSFTLDDETLKLLDQDKNRIADYYCQKDSSSSSSC